MKKILFILLATLLVVGVTACGTPAATSSSDTSVTTAPSDPSAAEPEIVTFADPVLEEMVRGSIGIPEGDITSVDAEAVTRLDVSGQWQGYLSDDGSTSAAATISDLDGLQFFTNLEYLDLSGHALSDIAPLAGLQKLTTLILTGNPITDLTPLAALTNLKLLDLTGCAAPDYSPLSALTGLQYLNLENSMIADVAPLAMLSSLKYLFLAGCPISNYFPLEELTPGLLEQDFTIAYTLAELGFSMDTNSKYSTYDGDTASVRINHSEWGAPSESWTADCIRTVFEQNGYKIDIGYYPELDAYVAMAFQGDQVLNYVYDHKTDTFGFGMGDRASTEATVRAVFSDVDSDDVLLTPVRVFHDLLAETAGLSAETLFEMPFDENDHSLPTAFIRLGFTFIDYKGTYFYEEKDPHEIHLYIHRTEWDVDVPTDQRLDWNMEFYDADVNGYSLQFFYYEADDSYLAVLDKDGVQSFLKIRPATGETGDTSSDPDTTRQIFNDAFGTEGDAFYDAALKHFDRFLQDRFDMGIEELYGLKE
jgi:hypothetical protein